MSRIEPDSLMQRHLSPDEGETVLAEFRADRAAYWKGHVIMAILLGVGAGVVLLWIGNPYPVMGPLGAGLAIAGRGAFLASEALSDVWRLTDRRLLGPGARSIPLGQIAVARPFLGAVQIVTKTGDKHLMKYMGDAEAVAARIRQAAGIA
jgi:hypothetical protein